MMPASFTSHGRTRPLRTALVALLLLAGAAFVTVGAVSVPTPASASTSPADVIVYVGQAGASTYDQSLNGVLYTETNILATEQQIADMSDRIVYVTQISESGAIEVIYAATSVLYLGMQQGSTYPYQYQVVLVPVLALPAGW